MEHGNSDWHWVAVCHALAHVAAECIMAEPLETPIPPQQQARPATGGFGFGSPAPAASPFGASAVGAVAVGVLLMRLPSSRVLSS